MAGRDALWSSGQDESVQVNQRALIDKVLARYSGEFTVFRELLQNSDDAQAKSVEIQFETQRFLDQKNESVSEDVNGSLQLPDLRVELVHQWTFRNDGIMFRNEDWSRLRKIAEGNPDEEKIGAFGVGFYSLFSVTDDPFVTSGGQWMGFYWKDKKDQLFARRGQLPSDKITSWTSFEMVLREAAPIPVAFDFTRFLASSITFMTHLSEVSVYFDGKRLTRLTKSLGIPKEIGILKGLQNTSPMGIMTVRGIKQTDLHIKAEVLEWVYTSGTKKPQPAIPSTKATRHGGFFSSLFTSLAGSITPQRSTVSLTITPGKMIDPLAANKTSVTLSIFTGDIDVRLDKKIAAELYRSTKKNLPNKLKYELIYTTKDDYDTSKKEDECLPVATGSIFQGLRADPDGTGAARVFIGHATGQTTGLGGHMATRFIPTVERESIDLMDRNVAIWNKELLYVGGFLARSVYEMELYDIKNLWERAMFSDSSEVYMNEGLRTRLQSRSLHALKFFTFHQSTPSADISNMLEAAFFSCATNDWFPILSTAGVQNASEIRFQDPVFSGFLKKLPTLPDEVVAGAQKMVDNLRNRGLLKLTTFQDVLKELRSRPLREDETIACLKWWISLKKQDENAQLSDRCTELLDAAVLAMGGLNNKDEKIIPLGSLRTFIDLGSVGNIISLGGPLPDHLLPINISKNFAPYDISSSFPWTELTIPDWLIYICTPAVRNANVEHDIAVSALWASRVLVFLCNAWPTLSNLAKEKICLQLQDKTCIPTSGGMKQPDQAYFAEANIFHDLPVVQFPSQIFIGGTQEQFLRALGVRKHVDLQLVFDRMVKTNEWTIAELVRYLVSVRSTLTPEELSRLRHTTAFSAELVPTLDSPKPRRYRALQLYEPIPAFRDIGLPVIDWGKQNKWRAYSKEAEFLFELGLRRFPPLDVLVTCCASTDPNIRRFSLKYLLDKIDTYYQDFDPAVCNEVKFIPAIKGGKPCLGTLTEVFSNQDWAKLDFLVTDPDLEPNAIAKLQISPHPSTSQLISMLEKMPPSDEAQGRLWFDILAGRVHEFSTSELQRLAELPIVPTKTDSDDSDVLRWFPPAHCYFLSRTKDKFHSRLFVFVDFGTPANSFLSACGTKHEPTTDEIALILLRDPHRFYELSEGPTQFLAELRNIAVNSRLIEPATISKMEVTPILLGTRRKPRKTKEKEDSDYFDDDEWDLQYDLRKPQDIIIADDTHAHRAFGDSFFTAPQEDILEGFYAELGSRRLSTLIKEQYERTGEIEHSKTAADTRTLILERLPLFLHGHTHARTRVSYGWLSSGSNFLVKTYVKLTVTKSLEYGNLYLAQKQDASAVAQRLGDEAVILSLAENAQIDMYEVATCLNRLFFDVPKANDALLFMTILSTDLNALRRRGYNVNRILKQQQAERQAVENARLKIERVSLVSSQPKSESTGPLHPPAKSPDTPRVLPFTEATDKQVGTTKRLPKMRTQKFGFLFPSEKSPVHAPSFETGHSGTPPPLPNNATRPVTQRPTNSGAHVTPLSSISSNINMAIKACRPEASNLLRNREEMRQVQESLDEGYCDISGRADNLRKIGEMGNVKVFLSPEVPGPQTFMSTKREPLARFIHVMTALGQIYDLPLTNLHVFYDVAGGMIAFNRNGSIFLNLRYYQEWHDGDVYNGNFNSAYTSWYFTLAHEIAHNLVQPHNSEHEFYFSAICERHIIGLGKLLWDAK